MKDIGAARRYAQALFNEAQKKNQVLACMQGLEELSRIVKLTPCLQEALEHPFIPIDEKKRVLHSALGEYGTPLLETFLSLLVAKHRFALLSAILEAFRQEVDQSQGIEPLTVRTAAPLSEAQQKDLKTKIEAWLKAKVRMTVQLDPQLIGGVVIQTRDHILDQSLKGQLKRLQQQLIG
jgi:F-type H+-transporting ATPase subunit delta